MAACAMPILALGAEPPLREVLTTSFAVLVAVAVSVVFSRRAAGGRWIPWFGVALLGVAALLYSVTPPGVATAVIALLSGSGAGLAAGPPQRSGARPAVFAVAVLAGAVSVVGARLVLGPGPDGLIVGVAMAVPSAALASIPGIATEGADAEPAAVPRSARRTRRALLMVSAGVSLILVAWTGANDPQLSWFGPVIANGPRDQQVVALTFDDGPNDRYTLAVADILEQHNTSGTFFLVGKAVDRSPEVARSLVERGHLIGNHSYDHDYWGWLDPRYPELEQTQRAIHEATGICPRLFRPPHGQRTPMMSAQVADRGMQTITWDVSGGDWSTTDGELVARRILDRVEPGSIILLHDSLDGDVGADRRVLVEALPLILDGLEDRGLTPVRLDDLIDSQPYSTEC